MFELNAYKLRQSEFLRFVVCTLLSILIFFFLNQKVWRRLQDPVASPAVETA